MEAIEKRGLCLFCGSQVLEDSFPVIKIEDGCDDGGGLGGDEEVRDTFADDERVMECTSSNFITVNCREDDVIADDLKCMFVVRKLLDIPETKCQEYLQNEKEEYPSPGSWFELCPACNQSVLKCYQIYRKLMSLEKELTNWKSTIKNLIAKSKSVANNRGVKTSQALSVSDDIRSIYIGTPSQEYEDIFMANATEKESCDLNLKAASTTEPEELVAIVTNSISNLFESGEDEDESVQSKLDTSPSPQSMSDCDGNESDDSDWDWTPFEQQACSTSRSNNSSRRLRKRKVDGGPPPEMLDVDRSESNDSNWIIKTKISNQDIPSTKCCFTTKSAETMDSKNKAESVAGSESNAGIQTKRRGRPVGSRNRYTRRVRRDHCKSSKLPRLRFRSCYCTKCPANYYEQKDLTVHELLHESNSGTACPHCGWLCHKQSLISHIIRRHGKLNTQKNDIGTALYCDYCDKICLTELSLRKHFNVAHVSKPLVSCEDCDQSFVSKQLLMNHTTFFHPGSKLLIESNSEIIEGSFTCPHCQTEPFSTKGMLDYHIEKDHLDLLLHCKLCDFKANRRRWFKDLKEHMRIKHADINTKLNKICEICAKRFSSSCGLQYHKNRFHYKELGIDPWKCPKCDLVFAKEIFLRNHLTAVHDKVKPFCCEHCGNGFTTAASLRKHVLLHTVPRELQYKKGPFFCEHCNAKFNVRQGLYYHMKNSHSDKYSYRCSKCNKGYAMESWLQQHERKCKGK